MSTTMQDMQPTRERRFLPGVNAEASAPETR
jgi:hypothetical protein